MLNCLCMAWLFFAATISHLHSLRQMICSWQQVIQAVIALCPGIRQLALRNDVTMLGGSVRGSLNNLALERHRTVIFTNKIKLTRGIDMIRRMFRLLNSTLYSSFQYQAQDIYSKKRCKTDLLHFSKNFLHRNMPFPHPKKTPKDSLYSLSLSSKWTDAKDSVSHA